MYLFLNLEESSNYFPKADAVCNLLLTLICFVNNGKKSLF